MRNHELNNVRISNPDGLYKKYREPNRIAPKNMRHGAIREASSRSVRETVRVAEFYRRRVKKRAKRQAKGDGVRKAARGASMAGHALLIFTAVVFCAVVYVSSLTIRVRPCSSMATALAFQTSFRNPDETPLRATLYSEDESYDKDFVGVAYLLFEGLEKKTKYALSIVNLETEEKIYSSTFLTAEEDPYQIQVEDPVVTPEGLFQFSLAIGGLESGAFYTVYVMDENGKTVSVTDHSETQASFSIPIKSLAAPSEETGEQSGGTGQQSGATGQQSGGTETQSGAMGQQSGGTGTQSGATGEQSGATEQTSVETGEEAAETGETPNETGEQSGATGETSGEAAQQWDIDTLPFITVKVNGRTFLPRVWNNEKEPEAVPQPVAEDGAETPDADEITWIWNEEHTEAEALIPDPENPEEAWTVRAEVTETVVKEAGCEEEGLAVYTASASNAEGLEESDVQTVVIPATGHHYERVRTEETDGGTSAEYVCADCGKSYLIDATFIEERD
ncbi:MAG: hypothetical protein IJR54_05690 [Oscillibacter sp.]|nr:hypothetical protein [Oscillibacter sp.]